MDKPKRSTDLQQRSTNMSHQKKSMSDVKLLNEKIKDVRIAMLTTIEPDGTLRSRPMVTPGYGL
jgi:general stress protein 26